MSLTVNAPHRRKPDGIKFGYGNYADKGCEVAPLCTDCPLPVCKHDMTPEEQASARYQVRDTLIRKLRDAGATVEQIAEAGGLGRRTVSRILNGR